MLIIFFMAYIIDDSSDEIIDGYNTFAFPIIRKVFPSLMSNSIVNIQPMTAPVGGIFFMDYVYGDQSKIEAIEKLLASAVGKEEMRAMFVEIIRKNQDKLLLGVVKELYPSELDMLEKLLILK